MEMRRIVVGNALRWMGGAVLLSALSFVPGLAEAQTPYAVQVVSETYQALPLNGGTATPISLSGDDSATQANAPFPVTFFDQVYTDFRVTTNGYAIFSSDSGTDWTNDAIPSTSTPSGMVAVYWDDHYCDSGQVSSQTLGTAPNRQFVVQWHCYERLQPSNTWQAQMWVTEGSTSIKVLYGANAGGGFTASVGIENPGGTIGYAPSTCGAAGNCGASNWTANQAVIYAQGPDLAVPQVTGEAIAYSGVTSHYEAEVRNVGGEDSLGFGLRFWVSSDTTLSADDAEVGLATPNTQDAVPGASVHFTLDAPIPLGLNPGVYYLLAEADPLDAVVEDNEANNVGHYGPIEIGLPAPDLIVESISVPDGAEPGTTFALEWSVANIGNLIGTDVPYALVLSTNDVVSSSDRRIFSSTITADALTTVPVLEDVELPADVNAGTYYLGIVIDPDNEVYELGELNNEGVSAASFAVSSGDLSVLTTTLPPAEIGSSYCTLLDVAGGTGRYTWALESGALPPGLALQEERSGIVDPAEPPLATLLCGRPSAVGTSNFSLRVTSGDYTLVQDYQLVVNQTGMPLVIATAELPVAAFQVDYEATLLAVGGDAPYTWSVVGGELPPGMQLSPSGSLRGMPMVDGNYPLSVEVQDASGATRSTELLVRVASPARLTCVSRSLPSRKVGETYEELLLAAGGTKPYTWTTLESRRLSNGVTDSGQTFVNSPPPGLILSGDGDVSGAPSAAGRYVWLVEVTDAENNSPDTCALTFEVSFDQGISVVTTALADAYVDAPYTAQLQASGAVGFTSWTVAQGSALPEGLSLSEDGTITGVLSTFVLEGEKSRTFPFLVQVKDSENRINVAPLSITLHLAPKVVEEEEAPKAEEEGGCAAGAADPSLLALGAALGLAALRRRR